MARAEATIIINQPAPAIFAYLSDWEKGIDWQEKLLEVEQISDGPVALGTTIKEVRSLLGRRIESVFKITSFEPNQEISFESTQAPFPMRAQFTLLPVPGGTKLGFVVEAELTGVYKMAEPMVAHSAKIQLETDFGRLKLILEATP